jgi:hypothetical protein
MLLDYVAHDWAVQAFFIVSTAGAYVITSVRRGITRQMDLDRDDKRQRDAIAIERRVGRAAAAVIDED